MSNLWLLFITFIKINLLTTSGPASVGLLYTEAVGKLVTHEEFIEAVGYSSVLPGSDALQLAVFMGYRVAGIPGVLVACAGAILPPTLLMLALAMLLSRFRTGLSLGNFVKGLSPALAALLVITAYQVVGENGWREWLPVSISLISLAALAIFKIPAALVLLVAGLAGMFLFRS